MRHKTIFGRSKAIEHRIDDFLDKVSEIALVSDSVAHGYPLGGDDHDLVRKIEAANVLKRSSSQLRREIEGELYTEMLIPDLRGDVANLIKVLHNLIEKIHHVLRFSRHERPEIPDFMSADTILLSAAVTKCVESMVLAARAFFRDFTSVRDHVHKVGFHESEADEITNRLTERIFGSDMDLAHKNQLARVIRDIDAIADSAESVADTLTIYAIKRSE